MVEGKNRIQGGWAKAELGAETSPWTSLLACVALSSHLGALSELRSRLSSSRLWVEDAVSPHPGHRSVSDRPCPACEDWFLHGQEFAPGPMSPDCTVRAPQGRWLQRPHPQVDVTLEKALECHPVAPQRQEVCEKAVKTKPCRMLVKICHHSFNLTA